MCWRERLEGKVVVGPSSERTAMTFMSIIAFTCSTVASSLSWRAVGTQLLCPEGPWDVCRWFQPATHLLPPHTSNEPDHRIPQNQGIGEVIFLEKSTSDISGHRCLLSPLFKQPFVPLSHLHVHFKQMKPLPLTKMFLSSLT